jgi:hypothetical protein
MVFDRNIREKRGIYINAMWPPSTGWLWNMGHTELPNRPLCGAHQFGVIVGALLLLPLTGVAFTNIYLFRQIAGSLPYMHGLCVTSQTCHHVSDVPQVLYRVRTTNMSWIRNISQTPDLRSIKIGPHSVIRCHVRLISAHDLSAPQIAALRQTRGWLLLDHRERKTYETPKTRCPPCQKNRPDLLGSKL